MDGAQVGVLKEADQVGFAGFLKSSNSRALEAKVSLEILGDLTDQTLEGELADEQLGGLLVATDLTKSHGTRPVTVRFLDTTGGWGTLTSGLGGELLARSLSSSGFASGLLGTSHCLK